MKNAIRISVLAVLLFSAKAALSLYATNFSASDLHTSDFTCNRSPVITCPSNYFGCEGDNVLPDDIGWATAVAGDPDCPTPVVTYTDQIETNDACNGGIMIKRFWRADYPNNSNPWLYAECTQVIFLEDTEAPVISDCPANISVNSDNDCRAVVTWTAPTATDDCELISLSSNIPSGSTFGGGVTVVTYTATDGCGNTSQCSFTVTVNETCCTEDPIITCPANYTACLTGSIAPEVAGQATASFSNDQCGDATITYADVVVSTGPCDGAKVINRTWTATHPDYADLTASCTQVITLMDDVKPVISNCPTDIVINSNSDCQAVATWTAPTATDNCELSSLTANVPSGSTFGSGVTVVTYTAIDACGNSSQCSFTVTVIETCCTEDPIITCPANYTTCLTGSIAPEFSGQATASFSNAQCGNPTITYVDQTVSEGPCSGAKVINRVWTATHPEEGDLTVSCTQVIIVKDDVAPTITGCPSDITIESNSGCNAVVTWTMPVANDNCAVKSFLPNIPIGSTFPPGVTVVTYTALDYCDNSMTCSFTVTVVETCCDDLPTISCPSDFVGCVGSSIDPIVTGTATASYSNSNCGTATVSYTDEVISTGPCDGAQVISRTWTAGQSVDQDLAATCVQMITLIDEDAPVLAACPADVNLTEPNNTYTWNDPTVTDNCTVQLSSNIAKGSAFPVGVTTVVITAEDACGNTSTCSFTVTVEPQSTGSSLVINCPDDIVMTCGDDIDHHQLPLPEVNTDCNLCSGHEIPGFVYMGKHNGHQYYCSKGAATWPSAKSICEANGGHLAIINNLEENNYLAGLLQTNAAYIGLSDSGTEGTFQWVDGSDLSYTRWYPGQPNDYRGYQDYVELLKNGQWNDQYNDKPLEFIMEIPCYTVTQTAGPDDMSNMTGTNTVSYEVTDLCGNTQTCSFEVEVSTGASLTCPDDVTAQTAGTSAAVSYDDPVFSTCCTQGSGASAWHNIPGYVYMGYHRGSHYYCSRENATWQEANNNCRRAGGYLAVVNNAEENAFLAQKLVNQTAFIGMSDHISEGNYACVNGDNATYYNWMAGQPNNYGGQQHYVEMDYNGYWNDNYGYQKREYIMEMPGAYTLELVEGLPSGSDFPVGTTAVTYRATDACGNSETCSFDVTVTSTNTGGGSHTGYCPSYGSNANYAYVKQVQLSNILYKTGNNGGYKFNDSHCVDVSAGSTLPIVLTPGFKYYKYYCYWHIYMDFNDDGDFADEGEYVGHAKSSNSVSGNLPISAHAKSGQIRMRVIMSLNGYPDDACEVYNYGETEDFCLNIWNGQTAKPLAAKNRSISNAIELTGAPDGTDVRDQVVIAEVKISPNPVVDQFRVISNESTIQTVDIFSVSGQMVKSIRYTDKELIDISDLTSGLYLVRMKDENGVEHTQKLIKE